MHKSLFQPEVLVHQSMSSNFLFCYPARFRWSLQCSPFRVTNSRDSNFCGTFRRIRHCSSYVSPVSNCTASLKTSTSVELSQCNDEASKKRLSELRKELSRREIDAFIVPSTDNHQSEYPAPYFARRAFISFFDGSAGTAVITKDSAHLWTDGRYFLQAEKQLDASCWTLMRSGLSDTPTIVDFLSSSLPSGSVVAVDPLLYSIKDATALEEGLAAAGVSLRPIEGENPVDIVWRSDASARPSFPSGKVRCHDLRFAGRTVSDKLASLRTAIRANGCKHLVLSMLDEVAWLFNIRADGDVPQCPVALSYARVGLNDAVLYVDATKISEDVEASLSEEGVETRPYNDVVSDILSFAERNERIWADPASTAWAFKQAAGDNMLLEPTPVALDKAVKNDAELAGMREAHLRDGLALCRFLAWLQELVDGGGSLSEVEASTKLEYFRAQQKGFISTSFTTIAGSGPNSAIIHYSPVKESCGEVSSRQVFLLDSGGQYIDGTTDVTRTMHLGKKATSHEKQCFTRVLKGHIAIDQLTFPSGTTGLMIDAFARLPLWTVGLDFRHGTGHGVGACLNVHEGPQSISPRIGSHKAALCQGMIVSNEPGYYEDGKFGIRIENLLEVVKKETEFNFGGKDFFRFQSLTLVPIDKDMIERDLLTSDEVSWLDEYHNRVWDCLSPHLEPGACRDWLWERTQPFK